MRVIWTFNIRQGKRLAIVSLALALFMGLLFTQSRDVATVAATPTPSAIYQVKTDQKVVALTFDISWGNKIPNPVLDVLQKKQVKKTTFFLSGPWVLQNPDIVKRIHTMGYEIGSHGWAHQNYSEHDANWIRTQVAKAQDAIKQTVGVKTTLIRTPNGDFNKSSLKTLDSLGYTVIQWRTDSRDWMKPGVQTIINRVVSGAVPGDIILLHASDSCPQTPEALGAIIDQLRAKGYQFVTVSELLANVKIKTNVE